MTFPYANTAAAALDLLTEFGQEVTRRSYGAVIYNPATGTTTPTTADTTRKGALLDFGAGQTLERGTLIQGGDKRLLLDPVAAISPQDHFIVGGIEYVIVSMGEINPAGTRVLYDVHLRR
jgi:hypothetical protein